MKKSEQEKINNYCMACIDEVNTEIITKGYIGNWKRLRSCTAEVNETENFFVLRSYNTLVAFIDKREDTLFDVLRFVYGFTHTSAQHISKFKHDYGNGYYGCSHEYTYYSI